MSKHISTAELVQVAVVTDSPVQTKVERNFGLPTGLYVGTVGAYLAFLGVMSTLFLTGELAIPMVIFAFYIVMVFGLPGVWQKMKPNNDTSPLSWGQFRNRGIVTETGPLTAREASVQVLILPVLILVWGLAIAVIVAFH